MKWFKGSLYGAFRREFLEFALHSPKSQALLDALMSDKEVLHPDELFFQTLAFNSHLGAPGACLYIPLPTEVNEGYPGRYVLWGDRPTFCPTKYVRGVCILGSPHVPKMRHSHHLFANKMHVDYYPEAYDCMEQWYFQRLNREWQLGGIDQEAFEPGEYMRLTCSKHHVD
ncbi:beta-1,3-galactosyl-O-glycosyl-glycoprotein beta-1,6-N-acetylglucosaminyltransferase activity [Sparganum proliferum]